MAYRPYIWRKNNPDKRSEQRKREKIRRKLRDLGIFPKYGAELNEEQKIINEQISNNDYSYWDSIKQTKSYHDGGEQTKVSIKSNEYLIWYRAKSNAQQRKHEFNLDVEDIIIPTHCPFLNVELSFNVEDNNSHNYYSIDRIDSSKGYVKGNIQIISRLANTMKNSATKDQLITFANNVLKLYNL
jgi:hypothetical protein